MSERMDDTLFVRVSTISLELLVVNAVCCRDLKMAVSFSSGFTSPAALAIFLKIYYRVRQ
jgi:hypothetical protein